MCIGQKKNNFILLGSKKIVVSGSTSIGSFHCTCILRKKDSLHLNDHRTHFYTVAVKAFNCGNFLLNKDFQKTLNSSEFPFILIHLGNIQQKQNKYSYTLNINLVGKQKTYRDLLFTSNGSELDSRIDLSFADFNLKPPSKLGNTIKVKDKITLHLHFELDK